MPTTYESIRAINYSALRQGRTSLPRMHAIVTGTMPEESSPALAVGTLLHEAMQHGDGWAKRYAVRPEGIDRRTKAGKEAFAQWLATLPDGAEVLESATEANAVVTVDEMRRSILSHPVGSLLARTPGESEVQLVCVDRKARLDKVCMGDDGKSDKPVPLMIVDWKSTADASPAGFARSAAKYGYHQQAAWYVDMLECARGVRVPFVFVAVESTWPYSVGVYQLVPDQLEAAKAINEDIVTRYKAWVDAGASRHHTGDTITELTLPEWSCSVGPKSFASVGDDTPF